MISSYRVEYRSENGLWHGMHEGALTSEKRAMELQDTVPAQYETRIVKVTEITILYRKAGSRD